MLPSLLPAFSAPNGVSSAPSFLASSAVTAAWPAAACTDSTPAQISVAAKVFIGLCLRLERGLEREEDGAAILQEGLAAVGHRDRAGGVRRVVAEVVDVLEIEAVLALVVEPEADRMVARALVAARGHRRVAP